MLWALLAAYLVVHFGHSSSLEAIEQSRKAIHAVVKDEARLKELDRVIDDYEKATRAGLGERKDMSKQLAAALERHDGTADDLRPALDRIDAAQKAQQERYVEEQAALRARLTEAEWATAFGGDGTKR
jgi:hypothetical protein